MGFWLVAIAIGAIVITAAYLNYKREQKRRDLFAQWAFANNWSMQPRDASWCGKWNGTPFDDGDHRRACNGNIRALNTRVEWFPSSLIASTFNFNNADYFEVDDPAVGAPVAVDFSSLAPSAPAAGPSSTTQTPPQSGQSPT